MAPEDFENIWEYYLVLEDDMSRTARYVEPTVEQEDTYSFEFFKILMLACCEFEAVSKLICKKIDPNQDARNISDYKKIILSGYPMITSVSVKVSRTQVMITPFGNWSSPSPFWWLDYNKVKHNRTTTFKKASYKNAINALAGLYISIIYLGSICSFDLEHKVSKCIKSPYAGSSLFPSGTEPLPGLTN